MTQTVDTLFINAVVLTMDRNLNQYDPGAVAVKGDSIVAVGSEAEINAAFQHAYQVLRARIEALLALPLATLSHDRTSLKAALERIGQCVPG